MHTCVNWFSSRSEVRQTKTASFRSSNSTRVGEAHEFKFEIVDPTIRYYHQITCIWSTTTTGCLISQTNRKFKSKHDCNLWPSGATWFAPFFLFCKGISIDRKQSIGHMPVEHEARVVCKFQEWGDIGDNVKNPVWQGNVMQKKSRVGSWGSLKKHVPLTSEFNSSPFTFWHPRQAIGEFSDNGSRDEFDGCFSLSQRYIFVYINQVVDDNYLFARPDLGHR